MKSIEASVAEISANLRAKLRGDGFCRKHQRECGPDEFGCAVCQDERADAFVRPGQTDDVWAWWACALPLDGLGGLPTWDWARAENEAWRKTCDARVLTALDRWTPGESLVVLAPTGTGKSSGLVSRVHQWRTELARGGALPSHQFVYASAFDLAEAQRRRRLGDGEHPLLHAAMHRQIAMLDEAQALPPSLAMQIIDDRYRNGLSTVLLGGVSAREFGASVGAAVLRRFLERGRLVDLFKGGG